MHLARFIALSALVSALGGCESEYAELRSGNYSVVERPESEAAAKPEAKAGAEAKAKRSVSVVIDREATTITVTVDGTATSKKYTPRPREQWPRGCPMNMNSYAEELADIEGPLTIGAMILQKPMLLARCPSGTEVMLTEAREFPGLERACPPESCLEFSKK